MPITKFISGRSKIEQISNFTSFAVTRFVIGLIIAAVIVIGLTNPSGAQMSRGARTESIRFSPEQLTIMLHYLSEPCRTGTPEPHMTKKE
jgi:hypothetical protein